MPSHPLRVAAAALLLSAAIAAPAQPVSIVCSVQAEWCTLAATEFEKETGIKAAMVLKGSGEAFAQIAAEKANPNASGTAPVKAVVRSETIASISFIHDTVTGAQALATQAKSFQLPSNVGTPVSPLSPSTADIKLVDYDFAKYGQSAERKRLLERWDRDVGSIAK